jgi:hypothetical protein
MEFRLSSQQFCSLLKRDGSPIHSDVYVRAILISHVGTLGIYINRSCQIYFIVFHGQLHCHGLASSRTQRGDIINGSCRFLLTLLICDSRLMGLSRMQRRQSCGQFGYYYFRGCPLGIEAPRLEDIK